MLASRKGAAALSFDERLALLVDAEMLARENARLARNLREAKLRILDACIEGIDFRRERQLDKAVVRQLAGCRWVDEHQTVVVTGATGTGKSYFACALAHQACRKGFRVFYRRVPRLFDELRLARADGTHSRLLARIAKVDVLVLDDFAIGSLAGRIERCPRPRVDAGRRDRRRRAADRSTDVEDAANVSQIPVNGVACELGGPRLASQTPRSGKTRGNLMVTWNLDTASSGISFAFVHLAVHFSVRHVVEHPVRGRFQNCSVTFSLDDEKLPSSIVELSIDAGSLRTGNVAADAQLRSADVFDVEQFPAIAFRSTQLAKVAPGRYRVTGGLAMRGVAREVMFDLDQSDGAADNDRTTFAGRIALDAADLGIACEPCWTNVSGASLSDRVDLELGFHATRGRA